MLIKRLAIKQALIDYANENNRPHFEVTFVKQFIQLYEAGLDHAIMNDVLIIAEKIQQNMKNTLSDDQELRLKLKKFCARYGMLKVLADVASVKPDYIRNAITNEQSNIFDIYERISPFFDDAERAFKTKKNIPHGTLSGYIHHKCRCQKCTRANHLSYKKRKMNLELI